MQDHFLLRVMNLEQALKQEWDSTYWIWGLLIFLCLMGQVLCVYMLAQPDTPKENSDYHVQEETPQMDHEKQPEQEKLLQTNEQQEQ
ncbi:unnamed protein product (macronuclear) [Paramecium tetraurelia]|uniref:Copper transporter n=1 Tax=Paramecium tetraurelia TaxID=5888 RepID=A0DRN0_PARTE|nr:uncharacterized protein GSPATT00019415001 [Paramecium tetraurelia]CAK85697.1 unnamed protein product [Paramecium tetraurelia]|eukprot:XP_001453094.1 hypothetical protein (macronuclear) [Paramecium tetraurelia strain d4-2]